MVLVFHPPLDDVEHLFYTRYISEGRPAESGRKGNRLGLRIPRMALATHAPGVRGGRDALLRVRPGFGRALSRPPGVQALRVSAPLPV